jgi:rhodanese-related sulfurtransferase
LSPSGNRIERRQPRGEKQPLPSVDLDANRVTIDPTWGKVQPMSLHPEIVTIGELEVVAHIEDGGRLVDTRKREYVEASGTIDGALAIEADAIVGRIEELAGDDRIVVFCNGPQCAATPRAVENLLAAGFPPRRLLYYRGGVHDWATLGYPLAPAP